MRKCDLINISHLKSSASKGMQVLDENSEVFFNFNTNCILIPRKSLTDLV
jgi:hypothetical protein